MPGIFSDEWRECLVAHYTSVLRADDKKTERTLRGVLLEAGFSDGELREITVRATAHVDQVGADFVPDMDILAPVMVAVPAIPEPLTEVVEELAEALAEAAEAQPQEVLEALAEPVAEAESETQADLEAETIDGQAADSEADADSATDEDEPPPPSDPAITQLSLF